LVTTYRLSIRLDVLKLATDDDGPMPYFLVEIPMNETGRVELERATGTLVTAQARLRTGPAATRTRVAGVTADDGRLVCLVEAPGLETVRRLVTLALLPAGRIREVIHPTPRIGADRIAR
jgi:hypothetical protein